MSGRPVSVVLACARPERVLEAVAHARAELPGAEVVLCTPGVWEAAFASAPVDRLLVEPGGMLTAGGVRRLCRRALRGLEIGLVVLPADLPGARYALRLQVLTLMTLRPRRGIIFAGPGSVTPIRWSNLGLGRRLLSWPWHAGLAVVIVLLGLVLMAAEWVRWLGRRRRLARLLGGAARPGPPVSGRGGS